MLRSIVSNASSILIAFLFAIIVWIVATNEENPVREGLYPSPIPVTIENRGEGLMLLETTSSSARVHIRGDASVWETLTASNFQVDADLGGLSSGTHTVPLTGKSTDARIRIVSIDPPSIPVRLEQIRSVTMTVRARILDEPPLGYEMQTPIVSPPSVTVTGAQTDIDSVNDATVEVALRSAKSAVDRDANVILHDAQGNQISSLKVDPSTVNVHVPIEQRIGYKDAAVKAVIQGNVASGYWVSDIIVDPATVTLVGAPDALNNLGGFVQTEALDVTGAKADMSKRVRLTLPSGVSVLNANDVLLRVAVEPVLSGLTVLRPVTIAETCTRPTSVSPNSVQVILSGPLPLLQTLKADDVQIQVDVPGCTQGSYQSDLHAVNVPDKITVESIVPSTAEVNVSTINP